MVIKKVPKLKGAFMKIVNMKKNLSLTSPFESQEGSLVNPVSYPFQD